MSKFSEMVLLADQCDYGQVNKNVGQLESWLKHGNPGGLCSNGQLFSFQLFWTFDQYKKSNLSYNETFFLRVTRQIYFQ